MSFFFFINWGRKKRTPIPKAINEDRAQKILVLPGAVEITRPRNDMVALNLDSPVNIESSLQGIIEQVNQKNGLAILSHPSYLLKPYNRRKLLRLKDYIGIEIYNPNKIPWPESTRRWDFILSRRYGTKVWGFTSDDMHDLKRDAGRAWIMVRAQNLGISAIINALRQGSFYSTTGPLIDDITGDSHGIRIKVSERYQMKYIGYKRRTLQTSFGKESSYYIKPGDRYVRIEVKDLRYRKKAWTQPVFVRDGRIAYFPYPKEGGWLRGCIHIHTALNGGTADEQKVVEWYRSHGYDFLAITEHNVIAHPKIISAADTQGEF